MKFGAQIKAFTEKANRRGKAVGRKFALEISRRVIMRTPVDTGHARANWQAEIGAVPSAVIDGVDPSGAGAIAQAGAVALGWDPSTGQSFFLANNLPYIVPLEEGWSKQAPAGMVRLTLLDFAGVIESSVAEAKREDP